MISRDRRKKRKKKQREECERERGIERDRKTNILKEGEKETDK